MKIGMKGDMGVADEMALLVLGSNKRRTAHVIAREARQNALICSLWWLEVKDCNENRHEGEKGDADEMALLVCRTARAAHVIAREARQKAVIRSLWWLEVKDCNENRHEGGHGRCRWNGVVGL